MEQLLEAWQTEEQLRLEREVKVQEHQKVLIQHKVTKHVCCPLQKRVKCVCGRW